jgi:hypothetical protein
MKERRAMIFTDPDKKFTRFKLYLDHDFSSLAENKAIINGMIKWGKMTRELARSFIISGSGPKIILVDDIDPRLLKPGTDFPEMIFLETSLVKSYEDTAGKASSLFIKTGNGKKIYQVGLTLLERLIRGNLAVTSESPDFRRLSAKVGKVLEGFEQDVYGGILDEG